MIKKPHLILVFLSAFLINIHFSEAQLSEEQIRTLPVEISDAKLVGQDLYLGSPEGLYHTNINNIDFKRLTDHSIRRMTAIEDKVFFDAMKRTSFDPNFCNGVGITGKDLLSTQSVQAESLQYHDSLTLDNFSVSQIQITNRGTIVTDNGAIYSTIFKYHGQNRNPNWSSLVFDQNGNSLGETEKFYDFASDSQYYYGLKDNIIFRSEFPTIEASVPFTISNTPTRINTIRHVNGQLIAMGDSYFVSEDHGESWTEFDYPHGELYFDTFEDGLYIFTNRFDNSNELSRKLRVSTNSFFSTNYDTIYNFTTEPFLDNKRFIPLNRDTFLASGGNTLYASFNQGTTWEEIFAGFWYSNISKPAVTQQARFFQDEGKFYRTMDEGLSYEEYIPNFISISGTTPGNIDFLGFTGHHNVLFCEVEYENVTRRLFRSTDQGDNFNEAFDSNLAHFSNGVDNVYAVIDGIFYTSSDDGNSWTTLNISEIEDDYNGISEVQQESNIVLVEYSRSLYYISYDSGINFSSIEVPDNAFHTISLENGNIFGIGNRGSTWLKNSEDSDWINTNTEAAYFNTDPDRSSFGASKIYSNGGDTIYSLFSKAGDIPELCHLFNVSSVHYSDDLGQTWNATEVSGDFTFTHNEDHYRYSPGFYKFSSPSAIDTIQHFESLELCEGEFYDGIQINQDTIFETTSQGLLTNDIYITEIVAIPNINDTIQAILCEGSSTVYNNIEYDSPGLYFTGWLQTVDHGCDSLVFLNLQEVETYTNFNYLDITAGEIFNETTINQDTTITEVYIDANGCDSLEIYKISVLGTLSTSQNISNQYTLAPNPTSNRLQISSLNLNQIINIEVTDLNGKQKSITTPTPSNNMEIALSDLPQGIYFITIYDKDGSYTEKIVKL